MAASREWVCVRLASYEDETEGKFLTKLYQGRTGLLNNTTFALLAPDGKTLLAPSGRGPLFTLGKPGRPGAVAPAEDVAAFAALLKEKAEAFTPTAAIGGLPHALDFRRALVEAACDNQPLVVLLAGEEQAATKLRQAVEKLAWSETFLGRLQYVQLDSRDALGMIEAVPAEDGLMIIQPDQFGLHGKVLASLPLDASADALRATLEAGLKAFDRHDLASQEHRRLGRRAQAYWETVMPVTDEGAHPRE